MTRHLAGLALLIVASGCSEVAAPNEELRAASAEELEGLALQVDADQYSHVDTMEVRLVNGGAEAVGYNLCSSWRERETADGWERIDPLRMCTADLATLETGATATWREPVDPYWGQARYRIATTVWAAGSNAPITLRTPAFDVGP